MTPLPYPLLELLQSQKQEIELYKWVESERLGYDIGWDRATAEWFDLHFPDWAREQRRLIDEALAAADYDKHPATRSLVSVAA